MIPWGHWTHENVSPLDPWVHRTAGLADLRTHGARESTSSTLLFGRKALLTVREFWRKHAKMRSINCDITDPRIDLWVDRAAGDRSARPARAKVVQCACRESNPGHKHGGLG